MRHVLIVTLGMLAFGTACGDSSTGTGGSAATGATTTTGGSTTAANSTATGATGATGATTGSTSQSSSTGSGACNEPTPAYSPMGCLTVASASAICGTASDQKICDFSVGCGFTMGNVGQCNINCEQGSSSYCNDATKTQCVLDATCAKDCAKLATCGFIL